MNLNDPATLSLLNVPFAFVVVLLTSLAKRESWSEELTAAVAKALSVVAGVALWYVTGSLHGLPTLTQIFMNAGTIYLASQLEYVQLGFSKTHYNRTLVQARLLPQRRKKAPLLAPKHFGALPPPPPGVVPGA